MPLETKIYQKENNLKLRVLLKATLSDMLSSRFLATQLAVRDIKAQYRQSYLGIFWMFITPLATAFVWVFLNNTGTVKLTDTGVPYPVYAFSGTLLWAIIKEAINTPMASTNSARSILTKINFPKEALIVSGVFKLLFNSSVKVILLIVFIFAFGIGFHWSLLWLPLTILAAVLFGITLGLFLTPVGMLYTDVGKFINFGLGFLMYITPVVYAIPKEGIMKTIMVWNPFTPFILSARDLALGLPPQHLAYYAVLLLLCIPLLGVGLVFYRISIPIIVERMSA
ncbi:ABC transporter permease [Tamlana crocina]